MEFMGEMETTGLRVLRIKYLMLILNTEFNSRNAKFESAWVSA